MQTKPLTRYALGVATTVLISGLAGCGSDAGSGGRSTAGAPGESPAVTPTPTHTTPAFRSARAGYWELSYAGDPEADASSLDGASISLGMRVGKPVRAEPAELPGPFASLLSVCEVDPDADLAIPAALRLGNASDQPLSVEVGAEWTDAADPDIQAALRYGDGSTTCSGFKTSVRWADTKPRGTNIQNILFLIRDYYSAEFPRGRPKAVGLQMVRVRPQIVTSTGESLSVDIDCYGGESYSWDDFGTFTPDPTQRLAVALHYPPGIANSGTGNTRSCD